MKIALISLGCPKNQVDADVMAHALLEAGHTTVAAVQEADCVLINTCGFIDSAKSEAIQNILELAELKKEGKLGKLLVTGCLSQRYQDELMEELPEVDGVMGTGSYTEIVPALEELMAGGTPHRFGDIDHTEEDGARIPSTPSYTAYLKIAEGCDHRCAFCIIPKLRGRYRSRTMESLLAEAKALADAGVKELIVIAQDAFSEVPMDPELRRYVKESGRVNQLLAKEADVVVEVKFGLPLVLKGSELLSEVERR
mgnify:CR=1 FL=1